MFDETPTPIIPPDETPIPEPPPAPVPDPAPQPIAIGNPAASAPLRVEEVRAMHLADIRARLDEVLATLRRR